MRGRRAILAVALGLLAGPAAAGPPAARLLAPVAADDSEVPSPEPPATPTERATVRPARFDRPADTPTERADRDPDPDRFAFKGKLREWWDKQAERRTFESDHAFDALVSPVSSPFLFEDPRSLTEVRPLFLYQKVPAAQPNFQGGNLWFAGTQARVAITDRFSVVLSKLGAASVHPDAASGLDGGTSLAEIWIGPKVTLVRDPETSTLFAVGATVQVPAGGARAYQDTGTLSIAPYLSFARPVFKTRYGAVNGLVNGGYSFSVNKDRSDYGFVNAHLDWDIANAHRFYPLVELTYTRTTTDGRERPFVAGEGRDLVNFGGTGKGGLLTAALGGRVKLTKSIELGGAYELPVTGQKDFFGHRITVDLIWRY